MSAKCLLLKAHILSADKREQQTKVVDEYIRPAIEQAGLDPMGAPDGIAADELKYELVEQIYRADIVVVDVNHYVANGAFLAESPLLLYYMALCHQRGNTTILISEDRTHLPASLIGSHHSLTYGGNIWNFIRLFKTEVSNILNTQNSRPDNPVQEFLREERLNAEKETEAEKKEMRDQPVVDSPITFRRVS